MSLNRLTIILWEKGPLRCTCVLLGGDQVVITLESNEVCFHRRVFSDSRAAADYAIDKMHAYDAQ